MDVVLVGLPGSGKTAIGRRLANRHGAQFIDLDERIETAAGRKIPEIFAEDGEPAFRRLEREAGRNLEVMWLTGRLAPDFKTIADFRRDNGPAIRATCRRFVLLCRELDLLSEATVAVDSSRLARASSR